MNARSGAPCSTDRLIKKRQRVNRACDSCRVRKTACDGRQPVCMACESRDAAETCRYEFIPKRQSDQWQGTYHEEKPAPKRLRPSLGSDERASRLEPQQRAADDHRNGDTPLEEAWSSAPSDGLATFPGNVDYSAYGPSSTTSFLRNILSRGSRPGSMTPNGKVSGRKYRGRIAATAPPPPQVIPGTDSSQVVLPLRRNADDFLLCYWEFIHPMFPLLHKTSFVDQYERLWTSNTEDTKQMPLDHDIEEPIFMSILNLVFALGSKLSNLVSPNQKVSVADDFYQKSRALSEFLLLESPCISAVQLLALSGVYLQSTQYASRCWNSVGLAIRAAQSLGLHCEGGGRKALSQLDREMHRRIWHTCVSLDRLMSMTFGRPTMANKPNDVPLPSIIDDEILSTTTEHVQPRDTPSRLGAFVFSCKLFDLLGLVLNFLSSPALQNSVPSKGINPMSGVLTDILDLNRQLDAFAGSIPQYLRRVETTSPYTASSENHVHLQQRVLHCRLMLVRLLLLRPLLLMSTREQRYAAVQAMDGTVQSSLDAEVIKHCCNFCLKTAYRLVDTIYYNLNTLYRSSGWHAVYFIFSAAVVLLASLRCPLIDIKSDEERFENCWTRCMAVFEHYRDQIHSAAHAILVLRALRTQITTGEKPEAGQLAEQDDVDVEAPKETCRMTLGPDEVFPGIGTEEFDPLGFDNISDAWFEQQLMNLDWLELPQL